MKNTWLNKNVILLILFLNLHDYVMLFLQLILLSEAEDRLNLLVSEVEPLGHKNLSHCSAGELEIVVEARLQLAAIALQRHRAAYR